MRRTLAPVLGLVLLAQALLAGCGDGEGISEEQVFNGAWNAPCNPRQKLKFIDGRHDAVDVGDFDAVMRQEPVHADLNDDGRKDLVMVLTCVPRGADAISGFSTVEAWIWRDGETPRQLDEPLLMSDASCSQVIEKIEGGDSSVKVTVRLASEDGCSGEPGDDTQIELALRKGEPVRLDPLAANFLQCQGRRGLAAAGNLVLSTRPHDDALLAQFPRDAQVTETDVTSEQLYVVQAEDDRVRSIGGWRLVEVTQDGDVLGCAWMPPA